jgi:hypothetical protein
MFRYIRWAHRQLKTTSSNVRLRQRIESRDLRTRDP